MYVPPYEQYSSYPKSHLPKSNPEKVVNDIHRSIQTPHIQ